MLDGDEIGHDQFVRPAEGDSTELQLSVIIPARNEAASIRDCLGSLVRQSEEDFLLGRDWELIVVDDGSTDATRQIATEFAGVTVLEAPPLAEGWTGKTNALWFAAQQAAGKMAAVYGCEYGA